MRLAHAASRSHQLERLSIEATLPWMMVTMITWPFSRWYCQRSPSTAPHTFSTGFF